MKAVGVAGGPRFAGLAEGEAKSGRDTDKAAVFIRELKAAEKTGDWPNFMVMSLGEDHTSRSLARAPSRPSRASGAATTRRWGGLWKPSATRRFWKETAIFVIEDDAQNGPDHVDAHRTVGLVISPWIKRGVVDSTMYTTSSFVRTMELILGLPPMTQFDAAATPLYFVFHHGSGASTPIRSMRAASGPDHERIPRRGLGPWPP